MSHMEQLNRIKLLAADVVQEKGILQFVTVQIAQKYLA